MPVLKHRMTARLATVAALVGTGVLALALPAAAHVTVSTDDAHRGAADALITVRVPNEEDKATTTKVVVTLPTATPIASVSPVPLAGWTVSTTPVTFAKPITTDDGTLTTGVGTVTWTATGAGIPVGQAGAFQLLVGPLPDAPSVAFLTRQTYSDGTVVQWVEPTLSGHTEPEHPAPVLVLSAGGASSAGASTTPTVAATSTAKARDGSARTLAIVGIVVGVAGLLVGAAGFRRARSTT